MIKSIKFTDDYDIFDANTRFNFGRITVLVGDQGCGKSTLLRLFESAVRRDKISYVEVAHGEKLKKIMFFDAEKDNPRTTGSDGSSMGLLHALSSSYQSHGETLLPILRLIDDTSDSYILLDEPESSLSLRSQLRVIAMLKAAVDRGNQIVVATHCVEFMRAFPDCVLSLEHGRYMTPDEFIASQREPSDFKEVRDDRIIKQTKCTMGSACKCAGATGWYDNRCENYIGRGALSRKK